MSRSKWLGVLERGKWVEWAVSPIEGRRRRREEGRLRAGSIVSRGGEPRNERGRRRGERVCGAWRVDRRRERRETTVDNEGTRILNTTRTSYGYWEGLHIQKMAGCKPIMVLDIDYSRRFWPNVRFFKKVQRNDHNGKDSLGSLERCPNQQRKAYRSTEDSRMMRPVKAERG